MWPWQLLAAVDWDFSHHQPCHRRPCAMVSRGAFPAQDMPHGASEAGTQQSDPCRSTTNWPSSLAMPMLPISTAAHSAQAPSLVCAARGLLRATAIVTASARCTMLLGSRGRAGRGQTVGRVDSSRPATASRDGLCCFEQHRGGREDTRGRQRALEDAMRRRPTFIASMCMRKGTRPATRPLWRARAGMRESRRLRRGCSCDCSAARPRWPLPSSPGSLAAPSQQQRPASSDACQCHPSAIPAPSQQRIPAAP
jgi:hypothetical protein